MKLDRSRNLAIAPGEGGYLIYDLSSCELHRLNASATLILEFCDGTRSESEIVAAVSSILADGEASCRQWIQAAIARGWLVPTPTHNPIVEPPDSSMFAETSRELRDEGKVLPALVCQEHATVLQPDLAEYWCALGELAHIVGRRERAREAYESYLERRPEDAEVKQIVTALRHESPPSRAPNECVRQLYSRFSAFYEENMCGDLNYQAPLRIEELLNEHLGETRDLDVLDLGCGTGLSARPLRSRARSLAGVDISPEMLERARATSLYDELEAAELTSWFGECGTKFDLIVACDTFIYFGDLRQVVLPAAEHLRPGGWLIFTVEQGTASPYKLTDSGRYSHSEDHVRAVADDAGLFVLSLKDGFLRQEYGEAVTGLITLMEKPRRSGH